MPFTLPLMLFIYREKKEKRGEGKIPGRRERKICVYISTFNRVKR
jgi:hypothetical protein